MRLKSIDNYLIGSMSILALACLYMLYGVRYFSQSQGTQIKVASIVEQIKTVKRKRDFYQSWVDVNPGDSLSQNDEIYTHGQSSAKIHFENGPEINLFENSLLRIKVKNKKNTLSLEKGNLTATLSKNSPKLDVVLGGKKYSFESQNANIQIEQGATENKFLLLDGKAKLNINEAAQEIKANQVLIQDKKTGSVKVMELPFIQKAPTHNSLTYFVGNSTMDFSWSYTNLATPAKILIAKNSTFTDLLHKETLTDDHFSFSFKNAGIYYWKLVSTEDVEGPIRTFTLIEEQALPLRSDKEIIYKGPKKAETVLLNWPKEKAHKYLLKIDSPDSKSEELQLSDNHFSLSANLTGLYQAKVKVLADNRPEALWSEALSIQVLEASAINITSNIADSIERVIYNAEGPTQLLSWKGPSSGVTYTVKLTKDGNTQSLSTENNSLPVVLKTAGLYIWSVSGETDSGIVTNEISGKILIKTPLKLAQTPSEGAVIELEKPDQLVSFKWDAVENSDYQFELSSDAGFANTIYKKDVESSSLSTALAKTGRYYWRVKIKRGDTLEYSTPVSVEIKPTPPLSKPEDLPSLKIKLKYLDDKSTEMKFHWLDLFISRAAAADPVAVAEWDLPANSRAREYIVEIYQDAELTHLVTRITSSTPHIVWKNAALGTFHWRVSYVDYWGRKTDFSKASTLSTEPDPEVLKAEAQRLAASQPIELNVPKHRENILELMEDEFIFNWSSLPETSVYQFIVARDLEFEDVVINAKVKTNEIKIKCSDFKNTEGEYYWKVITAAGNTSKRRMTHVSCTKKIEPEPIAPPEEVKLETKTEETIVQKKIDHFARLGLHPHKLTYSNKSGLYSAKVDGNVQNSLAGMYTRPVNWKYFQSFSGGMGVSRGKVFESITFTDFELNLKAYKHQFSFSWGPVIAMMKKTLYVEAAQAITAQGNTSPLLGIFIQKSIDRFSLNAEVKMGGMQNIHLDMQYQFKKRMSVGTFFDSTSMTKENSKHSFSAIGLNLNYIFPFLENENEK